MCHTNVSKKLTLHGGAHNKNNNKLKTNKKTIPLKFLITNFFEAPLLFELNAEVRAMPFGLCSVIAEKLALLSCRVSSAMIRLAL